MKLDIVYEDEYMIAVVKPYGVPSQADHSNREDMVSIVKNYLFDRGDTDEEPYVAVINRLDRPVAGILLLAKTEEAAAKLTDLFRDREIEKCYQAVVRGEIPEDSGRYVDWLVADKKTNVSRIVPEGTPGAKKAALSFEVLDVIETDEGLFTYLLVQLETGRHHQIRCQLAHHGYPIYGDRKYGTPAGKGGQNGKNAGKNGGKGGRNGGHGGHGGHGKKTQSPEIGLYSTRMSFQHPYTGEEVFLHREPEGVAFDLMDAEDPDW
ncbi:MAG: RNA pseudouridine synthase [Eubacterium sp.]|nr:RNA pseudouridine synthase [Eubacterium sp.]